MQVLNNWGVLLDAEEVGEYHRRGVHAEFRRREACLLRNGPAIWSRGKTVLESEGDKDS